MNSLDVSNNGKIEIKSKMKVNQKNLAYLYTPGVAEVVKKIVQNKKNVDKFTWKGNTIAVISDGSAILGLGNQGALPALPVMEAKCLLFKELGGINAVPIVLNTQNPKEIIKVVQAIAPSFGGINLEDIGAPDCFLIEDQLKKTLDIPVFHDDQHCTAIVVLAGLINALKMVEKKKDQIRVVISGAGAAGIATAKLLLDFGVKNLIVFDSKGPIFKGRKDLNFAKKEIANKTNLQYFRGGLQNSLEKVDVFIGLSKGNLLQAQDVAKMNQRSIVFALANPVPEIMPQEAKKGEAVIIATGRSDFPNQINNAIAFPGIFKGALSTKTKAISQKLKIKIAQAIASLVLKPSCDEIIPMALNKKVPIIITKAFQKFSKL